jgi:hypothetical protein
MANEILPGELPVLPRQKINARILATETDIAANTSAINLLGVLSMQTTGVGTDADTAEKDLLTYTLPANALSADGQGVKIRVWGTTSANAQTKQVKIYWGGLAVSGSGAAAANDKDWYIEVIVIRTGSAAQDIFTPEFIYNGARGVDPTFTTDTEDLTTETIIKVTGQNGTATANDLVAEGMSVEYIA